MKNKIFLILNSVTVIQKSLEKDQTKYFYSTNDLLCEYYEQGNKHSKCTVFSCFSWKLDVQKGGDNVAQRTAN